MLNHMTPRNGLIAALAVSASLLAGAHFFEHVLKLAPCLLCLEQREVHWTALAVGIVAGLWLFIRPSSRCTAIGLLALAGIFAYSAWLGGFHAGVEWGFWPGPDECAGSVASTDVSGDDLLGALSAPGPEAPPCTVAAWRFLGISMAGYNALISLGLVGVLLIAAKRQWQTQG